ncbi:MAG TPA: hypothetical protein VFT12_04035, partial [Thermoanaerobaculia bacterium]|nr:hypothetical protein [Thermoanaerobaculia bacterium]
MKRIVGIHSLLLVAAVACTRDLSRLPPYTAYVGKTLPLTRSVGLYEQPKKVFVEKYVLQEHEQYASGRKIATLQPGTAVEIVRVVFLEGIDARYIFAIGQVRNPETGKSVTFEYN